MQRLPPEALTRPFPTDPTPRGILVSYSMAAAVPVLLWVVGDPLVRGATLAAAAVLFVGARRAATLIRCLRECGEFAVDLAGRVEIRVARPSADDVA